MIVTCPGNNVRDEGKVTLTSPSSKCSRGDGQRKGVVVEARLTKQDLEQSV